AVEPLVSKPREILEILWHLRLPYLYGEAENFEGLCVVPEELLVNGPALAHRGDHRQLQVRPRAMACATPDVSHRNPVAGFEEITDHFQAVGIPGLAVLDEL